MNKYFCNITFLAILIFMGCAPKSEKTQFTDLPNKQYEYQPRNHDRNLVSAMGAHFNVQRVLGLERAQNTQTAWIDDSVGIFKLAENAMVLGNSLKGNERIQYNKFGHDLVKLFYQSKENATQFDKTQTMYLPAALGFEGKKIKNLFSEIATPQNVQNVQKVFDTHKISWPTQIPNLKPAEFVRSIKSYLTQTSVLFTKNKVSPGFVKTFASQVDKDYIQALTAGETKLKDSDQNSKLKSNAILIREVIQSLSFIPQDAVKDLLQQLVKARKYGELIEPTGAGTHSDRLIQVITNVWLDLNPAQRLKYIKPANETLYRKLSNDLSDKSIQWLAGRRELELTDGLDYAFKGVYKSKFTSALEKSCHPDVRVQLMAWLKMDEAQKISFRATRPELFSIFSRYSADEINNEILPQYSSDKDNIGFDKPFTGNAPRQFYNEVAPICFTQIQLLLDGSINLYLLTELDTQIRTWGSMIEKIVAEKTLGNLDSISEAIVSQDKFTDFFSKMAYPIMSDMVFTTGPLSGLENSKIQLLVDGKNQLSTKRESFNQFDSGAEVLGVSLAVQYRRILGMPEFEKVAPTSKEYYRGVFSQVNKMLSMIGFRTMDNDLVSSLHRNFKGDIPELDVYKYECNVEKRNKQAEKKARYEQSLREKKTPSPDDYVDIKEDCTGNEEYINNLYQIPDQLTIVNAFSPGSYVKYSSVRAQSEVIRGAALMLKYFADWRGPNDFDLGLGQETFSDIQVFPKAALVNLAVATTTAPIRGLQREGSPLKLFNILGAEIVDWAKDGIPDPEKQDPNATPQEKARKQIIQAAIVDLVSQGPNKDSKPSSKVKAEDMAYFMLAIDEFLSATDGIENTHATVLNPPDRKVKENMEAIVKGRKLLRMMLFAMSNFLVSRMQDADGGFWSEYVIEANGDSAGAIRKNQPRTLEVQLSVIKALLAVYKHWGSEGALVAAVESYYFMNQKLWSPEVSFYKESEIAVSPELKPYLYLDAVLNLKNLIPYINNANSQAQAQRMFDYYSKEFLKWNESSN